MNSITCYFFLSFCIICSYAEVYYPSSYVRPDSPTDTCEFAVDVAQVIDVSASQFNNMATIKSSLKINVEYLQTTLPESRSALTIFSDKPIPPLGYNRPTFMDYCLKLRTNFEDPISLWEEKLAKLSAAGGFDFPEGQLEAMIRAIQSPQLNWREENLTPEGRHYIQVMLMVTDSIPHTIGQAKEAVLKYNLQNPNATLPIPVPNTICADPSILANDSNAACGTMDYPKVSDIGSVFSAKSIVPIFMVAPAAYKCGENMCVYPEMRKLYQQTGNADYLDPIKGMVLVYQNLLEEMQTVGIIQEIGYGFQGLEEKFREALEELEMLPSTCFDENASTTSQPTSTPTKTVTFSSPTTTTTPTRTATTTPTTTITTTPTTTPTTPTTTTSRTTTTPTTTTTTTPTTTTTSRTTTGPTTKTTTATLRTTTTDRTSSRTTSSIASSSSSKVTSSLTPTKFTTTTPWTMTTTTSTLSTSSTTDNECGEDCDDDCCGCGVKVNVTVTINRNKKLENFLSPKVAL